MPRAARDPLMFVSLATLFCSATIGCSGSSYDSPQAAFDAMKAAEEQEDWQAYCRCMAPDTLDTMIGTMFTRRWQAKMKADLLTKAGRDEAAEAQAALKKLDDVLQAYGVDKAALQKHRQSMPKSPGKMLGWMKGAGALVEDKPAFLADMIVALKETNPDLSQLTFANVTLKDVEIEDDTAKAMRVEGGEDAELIYFKRIDGGWLVDVPVYEIGRFWRRKEAE